MERGTGKFKSHGGRHIAAVDVVGPIHSSIDCPLGDFNSNQDTVDADLPGSRRIERHLSMAGAAAFMATSRLE